MSIFWETCLSRNAKKWTYERSEAKLAKGNDGVSECLEKLNINQWSTSAKFHNGVSELSRSYE